MLIELLVGTIIIIALLMLLIGLVGLIARNLATMAKALLQQAEMIKHLCDYLATTAKSNEQVDRTIIETILQLPCVLVSKKEAQSRTSKSGAD